VKSNLIVLALLALVTFGIYGGTLKYPFVYDDSHVVVSNLKLRDLSYIPRFYYTPGMYSFGKLDQVSYRPFLFTTYSIDYMLTGLGPVSYRLTDLLIHMLCGFFVYLLGCRLLGASIPADGTGPPGDTPTVRAFALGAALLFTAHPVQSEAVVYVSARSATLSALACLASLWLFTGYIKRRRAAWLAASACMYALGLLTKETALPFALMFPLAGYAMARKTDGETALPARAYAPFFGVAAAFTLFLTYLYTHYGLPGLKQGWFGGHLAGSLAALPGYLRLLVLPFGLCVDHYPGHAQGIIGPGQIIGVLIAAAPLAAAAYLYKKRPVLSALLAWPIILMSLEILAPLEDVLVEYRLYLPMAGLSILLAYAAMRLLQRGGAVKTKAVLFVSVAALVVLAALSLARASVWQSPATLWSDAVDKYPANPRAHNNLGEAMAAEGKAGALGQFEEAVRLRPGYDDALNNIGATLVGTGRPEEAVGYFRAALASDKKHYNANFNLVVVLLKLKRYNEARAALAAMAALYPESPDVARLSKSLAQDSRGPQGGTGRPQDQTGG
jgi:protein O-mannosyl-transferase